MTDRRRGGRRKSNEDQKLTKEEDAIARYVRFNCPTKTTMFEGNEVHYFTGSKAVDILYDSKKYGHGAKVAKFGTRQAAVAFLRILLEKGLFFRARKLVPKKKDDRKDVKEKAGGDVTKSPKKKALKEDRTDKNDEKKDKDKKKAKDSDENDEEEDKDKKTKEKEEDEKKKRKVKLELHQVQAFNDANDVYVWIFDPTPFYKQVIGALMVLGTIAGCLFPLWPIWLRQGIYYVSVIGLSFFGLLIGVALARTILFAVIWAATMGKHKLWLLPNLTEDCGFFESFRPWYTYEYCPGGTSGKKKKKGDGRKKSEENKPLLENNQESKEGGSDVKKDEKDSAEKGISEKEREKEDWGNGEESDETGEKSGEGSDFDDESSQEETNFDEKATEKTEESGRARLRRRARKADDDFVLVDK